jgi:hypothetical protein
MKDPTLSAVDSMDLRSPTGQGKVILFNSEDYQQADAAQEQGKDGVREDESLYSMSNE